MIPRTSPLRPTRDAACSSSGLFGLRGLALCLTATTGATESSDAVHNADTKHIGDAVSMYWLVGIVLAVLALVLVTGPGDGSLCARPPTRFHTVVAGGNQTQTPAPPEGNSTVPVRSCCHSRASFDIVRYAECSCRTLWCPAARQSYRHHSM